MQMIKDVCKQTETPTGQIVVGASVLLLGLGQFGMASGITDMSLPVIGSVGKLAGVIGVVVGTCVLINRFM